MLSAASQLHELPLLIKSCRDYVRDKGTLLRLGVEDDGRIYPTFDCMGTITGRIMVRDPPLQCLKRSSRVVFVPDPGFMLLYPDYSQFEPGILADDSRDKNLISDFNSGDLYERLGQRLFGSSRFRKAAKVLFLAFCYGMTQERLVSLAADVSGRSATECETILKSFFGRYKSLNHWRASLQREVNETGKIGSRLGNYRYEPEDGGEYHDTRRAWILSQRIQGTASLILKRAILDISHNLPEGANTLAHA